MTAYLIKMFGISFGLTILIESAIAFIMGLRKGKSFFLVFLVNLLTNPPAVFLCLLREYYFPYVSVIFLQLVLECMVVAVEGMVYRSFSEEQKEIRHPFLVSVLANAASWLTGIWIQML